MRFSWGTSSFETGRGRAARLSSFLAVPALAAALALGACSPAASEAGPEKTESASPSISTQARPETTPPSTPQTSTSQQVLAGKKIMLDPGHNGANGAAQMRHKVPDGRGGAKGCNTTGTATKSGYSEHAFNWAVAQVLKQQLEQAGASVLLTRDNDNGVGPCVDQRGKMAGERGADMMLSIHANGSDSSAPHGFFVMTSNPPLNQAQGEPSTKLANALIKGLTGVGLSPSTLFGSQIYKRNDLATLNHSTVPVAMVELGEMRNPQDAARMQSEEGRAQYAKGLFEGIKAYFAG